MRKGKEGFFWPGYTDLMTTLFFVMLVLYALTYVLIAQKKAELEIERNRY